MSADIVSYFGTRKKLSQIDAEAVKRYIKHLNTEATTKGGKAISASSVQHHFGTLRNILEYARRYRYISADPCQDMTQKEKPHREQKRIDFLEPEQARRFVRSLEGEPLFWKCLVNVLITCGLRRGECVGLQWGDLDAEALTLTISRNVTIDTAAPNKIHIGTTKTGEARTVPISPRVVSLLMEHRQETEARLKITLPPAAFIFSRSTDPLTPVYPTEPTRYLAKFTKRHELPTMSPHDLRHTAATLALEAGANLKEVQQLLGHADPSTTMKFYAGVTEEAQRRTVEGIEKILE